VNGRKAVNTTSGILGADPKTGSRLTKSLYKCAQNDVANVRGGDIYVNPRKASWLMASFCLREKWNQAQAA
jgi:hypothetical protein